MLLILCGTDYRNFLSSDSSGSHYVLEFTAYRDTIGIPMQVSAIFNIDILDTTGNWNFYLHIQYLMILLQ